MDYSKLSDAEINQSITCILNPDAGKMALIGDGSCFYDCGPDGSQFHEIPIPDYCNNPADAWPIIENNKISITCHQSRDFWAAVFNRHSMASHANPLRAAMECYLMMQGDE